MTENTSRLSELTRLFNQYAVELYRLAAAIVWNTHEAEEIVQEAFLRLHETIREGKLRRNNGTPLAFMKQTSRNLAIDRVRRRQTQTRYAEAVAKTEPAVGRSPFEWSNERECERAFFEALGGLPDLQRTALVLRVLEGASYEQISDAIGVDTKNVKTHLSRARAKLRPLLAEYRK